MPRGYIPISKTDKDEPFYTYNTNLTPWMQYVMEQLSQPKETAVDQSRKRSNFISQINHTIKHPSRYATVEDAVNDMIERTGLNKINKKANHIDNLVSIIRFAENVPEVLKQYGQDAVDDIIIFIKNNIDNSHGLSASIPQIQDDLLRTLRYKYKLNSEDILNDEVAKFINGFIIESKSLNNVENTSQDLGRGVGMDLDPNDQDDTLSFLS